MKKFGFLLLIVSAIAVACNNSDSLFQYSTLSALQAGIYDGEISLGGLKNKGNFGIGTFNALDGEMLAFDGVLWQIKSDGKAYPVSDTVRSPFAVMTNFRADFDTTYTDVTDYPGLTAKLDSILPSANIFYAIRIEGNFGTIKVRSVPKQQKPYPPLVEVTATQPVFDHTNISGTLVGYRLPKFVDGINVPLYHLHFLDSSKRVGGHLLAFSHFNGKVFVDYKYNINLSLPQNPAFENTNLERDKDEVNKIEK